VDDGAHDSLLEPRAGRRRRPDRLEISGQRGEVKATGSQRPYDQGVAEAMAMMNALLGKETPGWIGVQSLPVTQSNVLESYKTVFKKDPPAELTDACNKAKPACN
jgi:ribose transport system substrate-binding protein